jgi:hypothetical protein
LILFTAVSGYLIALAIKVLVVEKYEPEACLKTYDEGTFMDTFETMVKDKTTSFHEAYRFLQCSCN